MLTRSGVGHREEEWAVVLLGESFIFEFGAVNGFAASTVACGEVTTLEYVSWELVVLIIVGNVPGS